MNKFDRELRKIAAEENREMPVEVKEQVEAVLSSLPESNSSEKIGTAWYTRTMSRIAVAVCAILIVFFLLPNVSVAYAQAVVKIPVLGDIVRVITIRNYFYSDDKREMDITVPEIQDENDSQASKLINQNVSELTSNLVNKFYDELDISGNNGYGSIYVDYETITSTPNWFTLKLLVHETAASSNTYYKYYHIDRRTGSYVQLKDLFKEENYSEVLTKEIREQMHTQMQEKEGVVYWVEDAELGQDFAAIDGNHNFYFNEKGELVIVFDKYEVGPGSMGCPEFVIPQSVLKDIVKPEFREGWINKN